MSELGHCMCVASVSELGYCMCVAAVSDWGVTIILLFTFSAIN